MHGYSTFSMLIPGPQNCCGHEMCTALPQNEHSPRKYRSCDIGEKAKQNNERNNTKCSKCFQFLCNNSDWTWFFNALTFARSLGRCWKPWPSASVFNTSHGTWRMLMHEKPCLIPILYLLKHLLLTLLRPVGILWEHIVFCIKLNYKRHQFFKRWNSKSSQHLYLPTESHKVPDLNPVGS